MLDAHELQTWQPRSIGSFSLQIMEQLCACPKSHYSAEGISLFFLYFPPWFWEFSSRPLKSTVCEQRYSWWTKLRGLISSLLPGRHARQGQDQWCRGLQAPDPDLPAAWFFAHVAMATWDELMWRNLHAEQRARCGRGRCTWPCRRRRTFTLVYYPHVAARLPAVGLKASASNSIWALWLGLRGGCVVPSPPAGGAMHAPSVCDTKSEVSEEEEKWGSLGAAQTSQRYWQHQTQC